MIVSVTIQIPSVQNFIVGKVTHSISDKTKSTVSIGHISISFPKNIVIENVFLDDVNKDTLLSSGEIKINVNLFGLLQKKLEFNSISLKDVSANIHHYSDSSFNFTFILDALASKDAVKEEKDTAKSSMQILFGDLNLKNIKVLFDDELSGQKMNVKIGAFDLDAKTIDLNNKIYNLNEIALKNSSLSIVQKGLKVEAEKTDTSKKSVLPEIKLKKLVVENLQFSMLNQSSSEETKLNIGQLNIETKAIDLNRMNFDLQNVELKKSSIALNMFKQDKQSESSGATNYNVKVENFYLAENSFELNNINVQKQLTGIDFNHLKFSEINFQAKNISAVPNNISADINNLSASEQSGFELKEFKSKLIFDDHQAALNELTLKTKNSEIHRSLVVRYSSLQSISDSLSQLQVDLDFEKTKISTADILFFQPALAKQPFLKGGEKKIILKGKIKGAIGNLNIDPFSIETAEQTSLVMQANIQGLPDMNRSIFDVKYFRVISGSTDMKNLLGQSLPQNIQLPQKFSMNGFYKGSLENFNSHLLLQSTTGNAEVTVQMKGVDKNASYNAKVEVKSFDLGKLLKQDSTLGKITMTASLKGQGLQKENANVEIVANISSATVKDYTYNNFSLEGTFKDETFTGKAMMKDSNLVFDFDGLLRIKKNKEEYKFKLNLEAADLKKLNFYPEDLRISAQASADLKGNSMDNVNGNAGITKILIIQNEKTYQVDSLLFASINEKGRSEINLSSAVAAIKFNGTVAPSETMTELKNHFAKYFDSGDTTVVPSKTPQNFSFEVVIHNHPLLKEVFLKGLKEYREATLKGSFNSTEDKFALSVDVPKINFNGSNVDSLQVNINSDASNLQYNVLVKDLESGSIHFVNTVLKGDVRNNILGIDLSLKQKSETEKLHLLASLSTQEKGTFKLNISQNGFVIDNITWNVPSDNYIQFGKNGLIAHNFILKNNEQELSVQSKTETGNADAEVSFKKFRLETIAQIANRDSGFVAGILNGNVLLTHLKEAPAFTADLSIDQLSFRNTAIGNIKLDASQESQNKYNASVSLKENGNNLSVKGYYLNSPEKSEINFDLDISSLSMATIAAFSNHQIEEANGKLTGKMKITGSSAAPEINGNITFDNVAFHSTYANQRFELKNETIMLSPEKVSFNNFTINDSLQNTAIINGFVQHKAFSDFLYNLDLRTNNFMVMNSVEDDSLPFYGKLILDSYIKVRGNKSLPKADANIKLSDGSNFTLVVPEKKLNADKGEGIVRFTDPQNKLNSILTREIEDTNATTGIKGIDISANIEINKNSSLKILVDKTAGDSLVVKGDATLSFSMDASGKMSLTGSYAIDEGSYKASLNELVKKDFKLQKGSTIIWNGDLLDADIDLSAVYVSKTSPIDLVAGEIGGLSDAERNQYKQKLNFQVLLKMKGQLLKPDITFEIQLPPNERGALGGAVQAKLQQLNEDPSELNKQVFALLVLNRFVQQDPLASEGGGGTEELARNSVSKFLSQQLNKFSEQYVKGVELNFDLQSYDDYSSGDAEGRTELNVGVKKTLFNDRLSVQVGGSVDLEGEKSRQNNVSDLTGDVTLEYQLTDNGRYRLKAFRQNQYEGAIEGELNETGFGVIYTRDFNLWRELFRRDEKIKTAFDE